MNKYRLISKINSGLIYLPWSIFMNFKTLGEFVISSKLRLEFKKNKRLKGLHKGKRCFIIGNGPSIKDQDLTLLKDEYTFVTNYFILHDLAAEINPNFYCIVDNALHEGRFPIEQLFKIDEKLPNSTCFFRYKAKKHVEKNGIFENSKVRYLKNKAYLNELWNINMRLNGCIPGTVNVIHTCIIIAAYMGFEEIYLLGCDSTLYIPRPDHFYNATELEKTIEVNMDEKLFYTSYMFKSYSIIKRLFNRKKIKIYNATNGGVLDVFPRVRFEEIIKKKNV